MTSTLIAMHHATRPLAPLPALPDGLTVISVNVAHNGVNPETTVSYSDGTEARAWGALGEHPDYSFGEDVAIPDDAVAVHLASIHRRVAEATDDIMRSVLTPAVSEAIAAVALQRPLVGQALLDMTGQGPTISAAATAALRADLDLL